MSQLIESIRIYNGRVSHIQWHNKRFNHARNVLFGIKKEVDLRRFISVPENRTMGLVKCRILYDQEIRDITFEPYTIRNIRSVKLIESGPVDYRHKFADRQKLDQLRNSVKMYDEIIMTNTGILTDAYYYNVVLKQNNQLLTPIDCLIHGIQRSRLLEKKVIKAQKLTVEDLSTSDRIFLINALTPLGAVSLLPEQIDGL